MCSGVVHTLIATMVGGRSSRSLNARSRINPRLSREVSSAFCYRLADFPMVSIGIDDSS